MQGPWVEMHKPTGLELGQCNCRSPTASHCTYCNTQRQWPPAGHRTCWGPLGLNTTAQGHLTGHHSTGGVFSTSPHKISTQAQAHDTQSHTEAMGTAGGLCTAQPQQGPTAGAQCYTGAPHKSTQDSGGTCRVSVSSTASADPTAL